MYICQLSDLMLTLITQSSLLTLNLSYNLMNVRPPHYTTNNLLNPEDVFYLNDFVPLGPSIALLAWVPSLL
jgi:hypothetical protein